MLSSGTPVDLPGGPAPTSPYLQKKAMETPHKNRFLSKVFSHLKKAPAEVPPDGPTQEEIIPDSKVTRYLMQKFFYPASRGQMPFMDQRPGERGMTERDSLLSIYSAQEMPLKTRDGVTLDVLHVPGEGNNHKLGPTVVLIPPNAYNGVNLMEWAIPYLKKDINVVLLSLRGYGKSEGSPSELGTYIDVQTVHDWLTSIGIAPQEIMYHGISIGGAVAAAAAEHNPGTHLILDQTFPTLPEVGNQFAPGIGGLTAKTLFPKGMLSDGYVSDRYNTEEKVRRVKGEVLVISAVQDQVMPPCFAARLFAARYPSGEHAERLMQIPGGHVTNVFDCMREVRKPLDDFLTKIGFSS